MVPFPSGVDHLVRHLVRWLVPDRHQPPCGHNSVQQLQQFWSWTWTIWTQCPQSPSGCCWRSCRPSAHKCSYFYFHQIKIYDWFTSACLNISSFWGNENECFQEDKILKMCIHFWRLETDVHRHSSWNIENTFSSSAHTETHVKTSSLLILTFSSPPLSFRLHRSRGGLVSCSGSAGGQNCWQWSFWQVGPTVHIYWWFGNY